MSGECQVNVKSLSGLDIGGRETCNGCKVLVTALQVTCLTSGRWSVSGEVFPAQTGQWLGFHIRDDQSSGCWLGQASGKFRAVGRKAAPVLTGASGVINSKSSQLPNIRDDGRY